MGKQKCELEQRKNCGVPIVVHLLLPPVLRGSELLSCLHSDDDSMTTYESCGDE